MNRTMAEEEKNPFQLIERVNTLDSTRLDLAERQQMSGELDRAD